MSSIVERANAEADLAEAENPDDPYDEEAHEGDVEPEESDESAQAGPTESDIRKMGEKIDREDTRHTARLREILGEQFDLYKECPLCQIAGHVLPYPPGAVEPLQRAAIAAAMGEELPPELLEAPEATMCPVCAGWGETKTKSKNPLHLTKICSPCDGKGWMNTLEWSSYDNQRMERERTASLLANGPTLSVLPGQVKTEPYPDHAVPFIPAPGTPDNWGRPSGHPMWGSPNRADGSAI